MVRHRIDARRLRATLADDSGIALVVVMAVIAIVFLLAMSLAAVVTFQMTQVQKQENRTKALHVADAGLNAYLYQLRRDPTYYVGNPVLGPRTLDDGTWQVTATPPTQNEPLKLTCVGTVPSRNASRTVVATVRFPTYADFMFLAASDIRIGDDAVIEGKVRSNGSVENDGRVTGKVIAHGSITGSGVFEQGKSPNQPIVDFTQVTADMEAMRVTAQASGSYYGDSGSEGYRVTFSGSNYTVERVTGGLTTGNLTVVTLATRAIPASGVLYFNDDVWVRGSYAALVTVGSARNIRIPSDLEPSDPNSRMTCGLIAEDNVLIPSWYSSVDNDLRVTAAMLARHGQIAAEMKSGVTRNKITIKGSLSYWEYGGFANTANPPTQGFKERHYIYDPRLDLYPPPMYPRVRDGSLKVSTWIER